MDEQKIKEPTVDELLSELKQIENRMKKARLTNDKVGYEIALRRQEEIYNKYGHIIYKKSEPTQVFEKRW